MCLTITYSFMLIQNSVHPIECIPLARRRVLASPSMNHLWVHGIIIVIMATQSPIPVWETYGFSLLKEKLEVLF